MKIAIIGAGAMGCLLASYLSTYNHVTLIDNWHAQIDHIRTNGLRRERDGVIHTSYPIATTHAGDAADSDIVIVMVKYHQTAWAASQAELALASDGICVTLQNGIGGAEILSEVLGAPRVTQGVTSLGATLVDIGYVKHAGMGTSIFANQPNAHTIQQLTDAFNQSGLPAQQHDNVDSMIWGKLIVNAGINALTAILRVRNGELDAHPGAKSLVTAIVHEAVAVATAHNVILPYDNPVAHVLAVAKATSTNRSSTLQDVLRGSPSEIATINGAIVRTAARYGITTPYNTILTELMATIDSCNHEI